MDDQTYPVCILCSVKRILSTPVIPPPPPPQALPHLTCLEVLHLSGNGNAYHILNAVLKQSPPAPRHLSIPAGPTPPDLP